MEQEKKEIRTLFNESSFTNLCKNGFLKHISKNNGTIQIDFSKEDILTLTNYQILEKEYDDVVLKFLLLETISSETIKEVLKRSPIYSELSFKI